MDSYQPIFDAVRSRIGNCDVSNAVESAIRDAFGSANHYMACAAQDFSINSAEQARPCAVFRPRLSIDGNQWCALYGENLQDGVAGFGDTPAKAMTDFDSQWMNSKAGGDDEGFLRSVCSPESPALHEGEPEPTKCPWCGVSGPDFDASIGRRHT